MTEIPAAARAAIGRSVAAEDIVTVGAVEAMMATLGRGGPTPKPGDALPPLWHGMFCTSKVPHARLGADGLPEDEALLPALPGFPAKLFAGARFRFDRPIRVGENIRRESEIAGFEAKTGRSGILLFARVEHRVSGPGGLALVEENDIIYRAGEAADAPRTQSTPGEAPRPTAWRRAIEVDPVLLFRHSAATFNSHRIHYDRDFVRAQGHPGLIVPGMLIARLMLEVVHDARPAAEVRAFSLRAGRLLYDTAPFAIEGEPASDGRSAALRAVAADSAPALSATVEFRT